MKKRLIITVFAATSALFAETNSPVPTLLTNAVPVLQVDLVEQARLVAEIGQEAAKGFDAETHARALRAQIEALLTEPSPAKPSAPADAVENTTPPSEPVAKVPAVTAPATPTITTSTTGPDPAVLRRVIAILRGEADRLEAQLEKLPRKP
ncbi:MAG: hypothetical protein HYY24_25705 [Verrucomicrobia bacterium]|nr:hypothetical protein [Verrucomicrobiota bacterium]